MKTRLGRWLLPAVAGLGMNVGALSAQPLAAPALEGRWGGLLDQKADKPVVVEIRREADGRLGGSLSGINQDSSAFTIDTIERNGTRVRLVVGEAGGGFEGVLSDDGSKLTGVWSELAITTPLQLVRSPEPSMQPSH
jgi:hypothetical protein